MSSISVCVIQSLDNFTLSYICYQSTEENTEWTIKNRQDEEKQNKTKTQHNMCWTPLYTNKHK